MATSKSQDAATLTTVDAAETVTIPAEEYARLKAAGDINTAPAVEEGPHLADPEIRAAKRRQLTEAGVDADGDGIPDDMRKLLKEKG